MSMPTSAKLDSLPPDLKKLADKAMAKKFPELVQPEVISENEWNIGKAAQRSGAYTNLQEVLNMQAAQQQSQYANAIGQQGVNRSTVKWTVSFRPTDSSDEAVRNLGYRDVRLLGQSVVNYSTTEIYILANNSRQEHQRIEDKIRMKAAELEAYYGIRFSWSIDMRGGYY